MKYEKEIETPGWRPADEDERQAVIEHCIALGMSLYAARQFIRYNAFRKWLACDNGKSVADGAKEWMGFVEEERSVPGSRYWFEELAKEVVELRKGQKRMFALLRAVLEGQAGEAEVRRILAEKSVEGNAVEQGEHLVRGGAEAPVGDSLEREAVDEVEGVESRGERGGGER